MLQAYSLCTTFFYIHTHGPRAAQQPVTFSQAHAALVSKFGNAAVDVHMSELQSAFVALKAEAVVPAVAVKLESHVKKMVVGA